MTEEEKNQTVRITNIQRFCLHDGPGIRTTVFFKGCSIHCPWCCNPENISYDLQPWQDENGESGVYGYNITLKALFNEITKDKVFYEEGGGVTLSGGEPLLQIEKCIPLLKELNKNGIRIAVETALFVNQKAVMTALDYVDWWYVDMKLVMPEMCRDVLGGDVSIYKKNLKFIIEQTKRICVRIPCIHGMTDESGNIYHMIQIIQESGIQQVELMEGHNLGEEKYRTMEIKDFYKSEGNEVAVQAVQDAFIHCGIAHRIVSL